MCQIFIKKGLVGRRFSALTVPSNAIFEIARNSPCNALITSTRTARCTVYVQYMYSIWTLPKRTNTVHILYIYCTTGGESGVENRFSGRFLGSFFGAGKAVRGEARRGAGQGAGSGFCVEDVRKILPFRQKCVSLHFRIRYRVEFQNI